MEENEFYFIGTSAVGRGDEIKLAKFKVKKLARGFEIGDVSALATRLIAWQGIYEFHARKSDKPPSASKMRDQMSQVRKNADKLMASLLDLDRAGVSQLSSIDYFPSDQSFSLFKKSGLIEYIPSLSHFRIDPFTWSAFVETLAYRAAQLEHIHQGAVSRESPLHSPNKTLGQLGLKSVKMVTRNIGNYWSESLERKSKPYFREGRAQNDAAQFLESVFGIIAPKVTQSQIDTALKALKYDD